MDKRDNSTKTKQRNAASKERKKRETVMHKIEHKERPQTVDQASRQPLRP